MAYGRVQWLKNELPTLVSAGVLPPESADRLRRHYEARGAGRGRSLALIAFGVLGAKLIGSGLILLIAHNWEALSQGVRAGLALALLLAAQLVTGFAHLRRADSHAWRESTAAFLTLSIGACMALVTQTYNIATAIDDFMLRWLVLALPVVYVTRSRIAAVLYFVGVVWATGAGQGFGERGVILWGLLAAIAPFLVALTRETGGARGKALVFWAAALAAPLASLFVVPRLLGDAWAVFYAALFAGMVALEARGSSDDAPLWQRPLTIVGALGASCVGLALTFGDLWRSVDLPASGLHEGPWFTLPVTWVLTSLLLLGASTAATRRLLERRWGLGLLYALPLLTGLGYATALGGGEGGTQSVVANVYVFALGLAALLSGLARDRLVLANGGMALLSLLFLFRFVDADLTLLLRGVAFIVIGVAFLGMNVRLLWTRKEARP